MRIRCLFTTLQMSVWVSVWLVVFSNPHRKLRCLHFLFYLMYSNDLFHTESAHQKTKTYFLYKHLHLSDQQLTTISVESGNKAHFILLHTDSNESVSQHHPRNNKGVWIHKDGQNVLLRVCFVVVNKKNLGDSGPIAMFSVSPPANQRATCGMDKRQTPS